MPPRFLRGLLEDARAGELIYSCLAFHGPDQAGELAGKWLVAALGAVGISVPAARQALFRLVQQGHVASRKEGRAKWYRLTATGEAQIAAGRDHLERSAAPEWDGAWTLVSASFRGSQRKARLQLLAVLATRGYGRVSAGLHLHPHDDPATLLHLVADLKLTGAVEVFRGQRIDLGDERSFVSRAFPLRQIAAGHRRFLRHFVPYARVDGLTDASAFALRLAAVLHYLDAAWDDPGLPVQFLPAEWPSVQAQRVIQELYQKCSRPARRYGARLAAQLDLPWKDSPA